MYVRVTWIPKAFGHKVLSNVCLYRVKGARIGSEKWADNVKHVNLFLKLVYF